MPPSVWVDERADGMLVLGVTATDADSDPLGYAWTVDGTGIAGTGSPNLDFAFGFTSAGDHSFAVGVSDGQASVSAAWTVHVRNVNRPPTFVSKAPETVEPVLPGIPVNLTVVAFDPDPDAGALTYNWSINGTRVAYASGPYLTFVAMPLERGSRVVLVEVVDTDGARFAYAWEIPIRAPPPEGDGNGDGDGDGTGDGDGQEAERDSLLGLLVVALVVVVVFLAALLLLSRERRRA